MLVQLKAIDKDIKAEKNCKLMMAQDKALGSIPTRPKQFKQKFYNKFRKNTCFQKHQANLVKYYKCGKLWHIQKNCRLKVQNNKNNKYNNNN